MTDTPAKPHRTPKETLLMARSHVLRTGLLISILAPLAVAGGVFGIRQGMFDYSFGQDFLALKLAPQLAVAGGIVAILSFLLALAIPPRKGKTLALLGVVIAAVTYGGIAKWKADTAKAPPIHDVATDWTDPLLFGATITSARGLDANPAPASPVVGELSNSPALLGKTIAEINASTCPAAVPVVLMLKPEAAYAKAKAALLAEGLVIVTENPRAFRLEATAATQWYGYKDDAIARIKPEGAGARIDLRSIRRTGVSDYGDNCARVTRLRARLAK